MLQRHTLEVYSNEYIVNFIDNFIKNNGGKNHNINTHQDTAAEQLGRTKFSDSKNLFFFLNCNCDFILR